MTTIKAVCMILMAFFTVVLIAIILIDYARIRKGKPSFMWYGFDGQKYRLVLKNKNEIKVMMTGLTLEEAEEISRYTAFKIEKE